MVNLWFERDRRVEGRVSEVNGVYVCTVVQNQTRLSELVLEFLFFAPDDFFVAILEVKYHCGYTLLLDDFP
jgi:hypothetical protein